MTSSLAMGMQSTPMSFDGVTLWRMAQQWTTSGAWSLSFWLQTSAAGNVQPLGGGVSTATELSYINVADGIVQWNAYNGGSEYHVDSTSVVLVNDDIPHHVVITSDDVSVANVNIYIDGVDRTGGNSGAALVDPVLDTIGAQAQSATSLRWVGALQDIAVFNKELSALEVNGLYDRSRGFLQESSADRVTRLLDDVGWPASWRDITTNPRASVGELVYDSATVNSKLQEVQDTERGRIFATKAGNLAFRERYYTSEVTVGNTVQQIFSDDGGATALPYTSFGFQYNEVDVTNDVTVTTPTTWASASDATSITANDRQSKTVDTILTNFTDADVMARGLVAQGKNPTWRANPIAVNPTRNTARWDEVLTLELGYRASMEITPMAVGAQNVQEVTIEQIEWTIEPGLWTFIMSGSPAPGGGGSSDWFVIGTSLIGSTTDLIGY